MTHSAAPRPARCISSHSLVPASTAARSAARICSTVNTGSLIGRFLPAVAVVADHQDNVAPLALAGRDLRPVGFGEAGGGVRRHQRPETAIGMPHDIHRARALAVLDQAAFAGEVARAAERAGDAGAALALDTGGYIAGGQRQRRQRRGVLDVRRTLARNVAYGGVLFETRWKNRPISKPKVIAICDVSRSVASYARFLL
ncbi:MAG TPA: hypothetical protein DDZ54_10270, partial [Erythrobacter sp.]|nr:hypothetical protein [Erythrobacter sp.]